MLAHNQNYFIKVFFCCFSELNLAVATHVSDKVTDEVINQLSKNYKTLVCIDQLFFFAKELFIIIIASEVQI